MQVIPGSADPEGGAIFDRILQPTQEIDRMTTLLEGLDRIREGQ
jgi:hypothetical protein